MRIRKGFAVGGLVCLSIAIWILVHHRTGFGWFALGTIGCGRLAFMDYIEE